MYVRRTCGYVPQAKTPRADFAVLRDTCRDLAVSLYPRGGFSPKTLAWEAVRFYSKPTRVVYVGD